jgi:hypothetical protein
MTSVIHDFHEHYNKCAGKNCANIGNRILEIKFINKRGDFCDSCAKDLLQRELAAEIECQFFDDSDKYHYHHGTTKS